MMRTATDVAGRSVRTLLVASRVGVLDRVAYHVTKNAIRVLGRPM